MPHRKGQHELYDKVANLNRVNCFSDITTNKMKFVSDNSMTIK